MQELSVERAPDAPAQGQPRPQRPGPGPQERPDGAANGDRRALTCRYPYHVPIAHRQTWKVHRRDIALAGGNPAIAGPVRPTRNRHLHPAAQEQEVLYALRLGQNRRKIRNGRRSPKKLHFPHNGSRQRRPGQTIAQRSGTTGRTDEAGTGPVRPEPPSTGMTAPNYGAALPVRAQAKRRRSSQAKHRDAKRSARLGATETSRLFLEKG